MNNQFENFITTFKNILKSKNRDIKKAYYFALNALRRVNAFQFKPRQQVIINKLIKYYTEPNEIKKNELNDYITQYYIDDDDDDDIIDEDDEEDEDDDDENKVLRDIIVKKLEFNLEDVIKLENYSINKLLSLYNITLKTSLTPYILGSWVCEKQLIFSEPYKKTFIKRYIKKHPVIKCNSIVKIIMASVHDKKKIYPIFQTKYIIIRNDEDIDYFLRESMIDIISRIGKFTKKMNAQQSNETQPDNRSGYTDIGIEYEKMNIVKIQNVFANAYISLPPRIINTKSCINIKNNDDKCFLYCHLLHQRYKLNNFKKIQNPERLYGVKAFNYNNQMIHLNYENIHFPIPFNTFHVIKKIEEQNKIRINIYEYKEENKKNDVVPIYHSKMDYENCMNLLVICDKTKKKYHYVYIKNLNGLLRSNFKHVGTKFCENCMKSFSTQKAFNSINHKCNHKYDQSELPKNMAIVDNKLLKCPLDMYVKPFNLKHTIHLPFVMYCDFESILKKTENEKYHDKVQHELSSYCYNLVCRERPVFNRFKLYRGDGNESVIDHFLTEIKNVLDHIKQCKKKFYSLPALNNEEMVRHKKLKRCEICDVKFDKDIKRVQHHNHISGDYIGTVCQSCNSKIRTDTTLYIVFHYLKGYDIHYIINRINNYFKDYNINLLGHNSSSIFHIDIGYSIKFIDSYEYIKGSLKSLSQNLKDEDIIYTRNLVNKYGHDFVTKDIFPFRYIDDFTKYDENTFPNIEYFDNVDKETYEKYRKFYYSNFNTLGEYSDYYLEKDVRLLSDIMETYRTIFMNKYQTEIFSHYSINSLTWEVMKKWCPVQIKILDNYKIYSAFESMARGGLCDIGSRYACANNKYMENYDPNIESSYIMHFDINSMYGHVMRKYPMPYDDFVFLTNDEINDFNIWDYDINSEYGFILNIDISEIDIKYHDYYNDLPLFPVKERILKKNISDYQKQILKDNEKNFISSQKLICNFNEKRNYTLHYLTLQFYLKMPGFKIKQINYIIKFKQSKYLKDYIEYNHNNRIKSTNENDKNMYKLMINSLFGRSLLNKIKYSCNLKIYNNQDYEKVLKIVSSDRFKDYETIDENNAIVNIQKQCIKLDSPSYIGACILDLSKIIFYDNWYKLKNKYKDNIALMYYDTDSYLCHIKTEDIYKDMNEMNIFDMSSYKPDFKYYKEGVYEMGLLKDENCQYDSQIVEACALKSKLYGYRKENEMIKYKGIKNELNFQSLKDVIFDNKTIKSDFYTIKAKDHKIYSYTDYKTLMSYTDKRYLYNPVMSYAYGHYMIDKNYENMI